MVEGGGLVKRPRAGRGFVQQAAAGNTCGGQLVLCTAVLCAYIYCCMAVQGAWVGRMHPERESQTHR